MPWVSLILGILITLFIVGLIVLRTDFFAQNTSRLISSNILGHNTNFSIHIEGFSGNILRGIDAKEVSLRYDAGGVSFDLFRTDRIHISYNFFKLIKGSTIDTLSVSGPHFWIKPDSTGRFILPFGSGEGGSGGFSRIRISRLKIDKGQMIVQRENGADVIRNLEVDCSIKSSRKKVCVDFFHVSANELRRNIVLNDMKGAICIEKQRKSLFSRKLRETISLDSLEVQLDESTFLLGGTYTVGRGTIDLTASLINIDMAELSQYAERRGMAFGEVYGGADITGRADSLNVAAYLNGVINGHSLESMKVQVTVENRSLKNVRFYGRVDKAFFTGTGRFIDSLHRGVVVELDARHVDLSKGIMSDGGLPTDLSGHGKLTYKFNTSNLIFSMKLSRGHFDNFPFESAVCSGVYARDTLNFDDIFLTHPTHIVRAHGKIYPGGYHKFYLDLNVAKGDTFFPYLNIPEYRGSIVANGVWERTDKNYKINASGRFLDLTYFENVYVHSGTFNLAISSDRKFELSLGLSGDSCAVLKRPFQGIDLSLDYCSGVTRIKRLLLEGDNPRIDLSATVKTLEGRSIVDIENLSALYLDRTWTSGGKFEITGSDSSYDFNDVQFHSKAGAVYISGGLNRMNELLHASVRFDRLETALFNSLGLKGVTLGGKIMGRVDFGGTIKDPDITFDICSNGFTLDSLAVDSLRVAGSYIDNTAKLDTLILIRNMGRVSIGGELSGASLAGFKANSDSALSVMSGNIEASFDRVDVSPIRSIFKGFPLKNGVFSGRMTMSETLSHPNLTLEGRMIDVRYSDFRFPKIVASSSLDGKVLKIDGSVFLSDKHSGTFHCNVPVVERKLFYRFKSDGVLGIDVDFDKGELADIVKVTDRIAFAKGGFSLSFKVSGTVASPHLFGELNLNDAAFRIAGMEENYKHVNARVLMDDTLLTLYNLEGSEGKKGKFNGKGRAVIADWKPVNYHFSFNVKDFFVGSITDVVAIVSGKVNLDSKEVQGRTVPVLDGAITVKNAEIYYELGSAKKSPNITLASPSWIASIDMEIPGNVWVKTPDARIELEGDVTLHHDNKGNYFRGELDLIRGWYNIYSSKFKIVNGKLKFVTVEGFRPVVDIEAETNDPNGRKIYLTFRWHQDDIQPVLSLRHEDPGYSETDIWKMLGGGIVESPGSEGKRWDAVGTAQNLAANYIEKLLNSQMQGVTVELETRGQIGEYGGAFPEKETVIAIGKYLSEGLYVKYKQGLSITSAREIDAEYRISRLFLIRSEIIRYSEKVFQGKSRESTDEINLDFRFRLEF